MSGILTRLLSTHRLGTHLEVSSKKRLFEEIAERIQHDYPDITARSIFNRLLAREKLGSTGLGQGIAIPHARIEGAPDIIGVFFTLNQGIEFDAPDDQEVDLVFALLVPENEEQEHLTTLATLAGLFQTSDFCRDIRAAKTAEALFRTLQMWEAKA
jgi:PTS system nitrogen regulatory IIA component